MTPPSASLSPILQEPHSIAPVVTANEASSNIHATAWDAKKYNANANLQFELSCQVMNEYLSLAEDAEVLDIGCGDARISAFIAQHLVKRGRVFGIDISADMIREATERYSNVYNLHVSCRDASSLSYEKEMDAAVSLFCMHWIEDKQAVLQAIRRSLKTNGQFLLLMTTRSATLPKFFGNALAATTKSARWKTYFDNNPEIYFPSTPEKMTAMITDARMTPTVVKELDKEYLFKDRASFAEWLHSLPTLSRPVPIDLRAEFIDDLIKAYLDQLPMKDDGSIIYKRPLLLAMGIKKE